VSFANESHLPYPASDSPAFYPALNAELTALLHAERDWLVNLANAAALLALRLPRINWTGFYLWRDGELVLGPFQGKPACTRIKFGRGVCGTAARIRGSVLVPDVNAFPGHIACDPASASELVVPLLLGERLLGVLDLDAPVTNRFTDGDRLGLEEFVEALVKGTDWPEPKVSGKAKERVGARSAQTN